MGRARYGGSTTAILIDLPGESSSAMTAIDGYQMARQDLEYPGQSGDGLNDRCPHYPGHHTRSQCCYRSAGTVLGRDRRDGDRQSDVGTAQSAADRHLGPASENSVLRVVPAIFAFSAIGVYGVNSNAFDLFTGGSVRPLGLCACKVGV